MTPPPPAAVSAGARCSGAASSEVMEEARLLGGPVWLSGSVGGLAGRSWPASDGSDAERSMAVPGRLGPAPGNGRVGVGGAEVLEGRSPMETDLVAFTASLSSSCV